MNDSLRISGSKRLHQKAFARFDRIASTACNELNDTNVIAGIKGAIRVP